MELSFTSYYTYAEVDGELFNKYIIFYMSQTSHYSESINSQEINIHIVAIKSKHFDTPNFLVPRLFSCRSNDNQILIC